MGAAMRVNTTVLPGQRIEVSTPGIPEGSNVELVIYIDPESSQDLEEPGAQSMIDEQYLFELDREYETLIEIQWSRPLTIAEQQRLDAIKQAMDAIDSDSPASRQFRRQIAMIHEQLAAIRHEVESLPSAS
jgi:hypothetical protein